MLIVENIYLDLCVSHRYTHSYHVNISNIYIYITIKIVLTYTNT